AKNLIATLLLAQGVPMLLGGDEFLRTQSGNNNAWCQDNEISWIDWSVKKRNAGFFRFVREMIHLRKRHPGLRRRDFLDNSDVIWHGLEPEQPDFSPTSRVLAYALDGRLTGREPDCDFYVAINGGQEPATFVLPQPPNGGHWRMVVDTSRDAPHDFADAKTVPIVEPGQSVTLPPLSLIACLSTER